MFDRRLILSIVAGAYVVAIVTRLAPALSPAGVASLLPSFGGTATK